MQLIRTIPATSLLIIPLLSSPAAGRFGSELEQRGLGKDIRNLWDLQAQSLGAIRSSCNPHAFFVSKLNDMTEQKTIIVHNALSALSPVSA
jgi:hypothetical protein